MTVDQGGEPKGFTLVQNVTCDGCSQHVRDALRYSDGYEYSQLAFFCADCLRQALALLDMPPTLVDGRVMRGDVEIEPKCPICGTAIVCPCGVGIGT